MERFLRLAPTIADGARPGRGMPTAPGSPPPACCMWKLKTEAWPSLRERVFLTHPQSAKPGPRDSYLSQVVCPASLAREILSMLFCAFSARCGFSSSSSSSFSNFRCQYMLVSLRPAVPLGSRPLSTISIQSSVCHAPIYRPSDTVGAGGFRTALIRRILNHAIIRLRIWLFGCVFVKGKA